MKKWTIPHSTKTSGKDPRAAKTKGTTYCSLTPYQLQKDPRVCLEDLELQQSMPAEFAQGSRIVLKQPHNLGLIFYFAIPINNKIGKLLTRTITGFFPFHLKVYLFYINLLQNFLICYLMLIRDAGRAQINSRRQHVVWLSKHLLQRLPGEEFVNILVVSEFIQLAIFFVLLFHCFFY